MKTDKKEWLIVVVLVILAIVWYLWNRARVSVPAESPQQLALPMPGAAQYWGPNGQPFGQGGTMDNPILNSIHIPVPDYGYSGNSQIYMPLFGFVGYSQLGTVG